MGFACSCIEKQPEQFTGGLVTKMGAVTIRFILRGKTVTVSVSGIVGSCYRLPAMWDDKSRHTKHTAKGRTAHTDFLAPPPPPPPILGEKVVLALIQPPWYDWAYKNKFPFFLRQMALWMTFQVITMASTV